MDLTKGCFIKLSAVPKVVDKEGNERTYGSNVMNLVLHRPPADDVKLPLADIRRNIRRVAALLQQQAPELFIAKPSRQRLFHPTEATSSEDEEDEPREIEVFITERFEPEPGRPKREPISEHGYVRPSSPARRKVVVSEKLPKYDNVRSSIDSKATPRTHRSDARPSVVHNGKKPKFSNLSSSYGEADEQLPIRQSRNPPPRPAPAAAAPYEHYQPRETPRRVNNSPAPPAAPRPGPPPPVKKSDVPKLPPNPDRLKSLVSRDFSKPPPPAPRPDPRVQQLAKPSSEARKPVDVFKQQQRVRLNQSMDSVIATTNYGEAEKPDPYKSKVRVQPEEEKEKKKAPYKVPKELKRALGGAKLPPIAKPKPLTPSPTPEPVRLPVPVPTPLPEIIAEETPEQEPSFVIIKDEFSESEEEEAEEVKDYITDSAYCTCDDYVTESEDLRSRITDDGTHAGSATTLEVCPNCGGKRSMRSSRVPSSIVEKSLAPSSPFSSGIFTLEPTPEPVPPYPSSPLPPLPSPPPVPSPEIDHEDIALTLEAEVQEEPAPPRAARTVLAPIKRQKGVYANGVRDAYIKALAAAEVRRLPHEWWMMLGPRISRSWVFSYFQNIPQPSRDTPPPPSPPPAKPRGYIPDPPPAPKAKKKRKKRFKPMKHIFGKVKPDHYFPGMKKNLILTAVELPAEQPDPPGMPFRKPNALEPLKEATREVEWQRTRSRLSSCHSFTRTTDHVFS